MLRSDFHPQARAEFDEAVAHYAAERQSLGEAFVAAVQAAVDQVSEHPRSGPVLRDDVRCVRTERFPFSVMYRATPTQIRILAVAHNRRRPYYWLDRR